jgi:hypothetical protein
MINEQARLRSNLALKRSFHLKNLAKEDVLKTFSNVRKSDDFSFSYWSKGFLAKSIRFDEVKDPVLELREKFADSRLALRDRLSSFFSEDDCGCDESD